MVRSAASVLLVDDDPVFLNTFAREFARRDWRVITAQSCAGAAVAARRHPPAMVVLDLMLGDGSGIDLIEEIHGEAPQTRIVITTGHPTLDTAVEAMRRGAVHYVPKPCNVDNIIAASKASAPAPAPRTTSLAQTERAHINHVIAECGGNISEAARRLGMHRRSLQRKLRKNIPGA